MQEENKQIAIPEYTKADFQTTSAPFEFLYQYRDNPFIQRQLLSRMSDLALSVGVRSLVTMYRDYVESVEGNSGGRGDNATNFPGQKQELWCGNWTANAGGIRGYDRFGAEVIACYHPIMPVRRLVNVDTGVHKVVLAYCLGGKWNTVVKDKKTISDNRSIIDLAEYGVAVNSDNARHLVRFLTDVEQMNYDRIPEEASVGRLGWIDGFGFSPYDASLTFDGDEQYRSMFEAVRSRGSFQTWLESCGGFRRYDGPGGTITRIVLASSFASVLVKPCKCLPFFVHLWGGSETGKTVSAMLAASVWADPALGRYIRTFNATEVGKEMGAAFFNSLPLILDEMQLVKGSSRKELEKMIYQLSEGVGRDRGKKSGGMKKTETWRNCIISTGEDTILTANCGMGAYNRTLEIHCQDKKLFSDAKSSAAILSENYGFAGEIFVRKLMEPGQLDRIRQLQDKNAAVLKTDDTTEKQTTSAALILTADQLINEWIFHDGICLRPEDLRPYLMSKKQMDQNVRAMEFLEDYVNINQARFRPSADNNGEVWGDMDEDGFYIIKSKLDQALDENGYSSSAFLSWARETGVLQPGGDGKSTKTKRIMGRVTRCVHLIPLRENNFEESGNADDVLPL